MIQFLDFKPQEHFTIAVLQQLLCVGHVLKCVACSCCMLHVSSCSCVLIGQVKTVCACVPAFELNISSVVVYT